MPRLWSGDSCWATVQFMHAGRKSSRECQVAHGPCPPLRPLLDDASAPLEAVLPGDPDRREVVVGALVDAGTAGELDRLVAAHG